MIYINGLIPYLGFGTYGRTGKDGTMAILHALETGYRHLDTAQSYDTEAEVGEAINASALPRRDVFVTTKITPENFGQGKLLPSLQKSLENLRLDTVDLTLIHWPSPNGEIPLPVYLEQLAEAKERKLTRFIGVSNFTISLLKDAERILGRGAIATNQIELNPLFQNRKVAEYCTSAGIAVTCYQPLAKARVKDAVTLREIAARHNATAEQIALAWERTKGYAAIPTSSRFENIDANFASLDVSLSSEDMAAIDAMPQSSRAIDPGWGPQWD